VAEDRLTTIETGLESAAAIVEALAGRHAEADAALALIRLAVTGQVEDTGGKYVLAAVDGL